jgi:hypothetical protein
VMEDYIAITSQSIMTLPEDYIISAVRCALYWPVFAGYCNVSSSNAEI